MPTPPQSAPPSPRQSFGLAAGGVLAEINFYACDALGVDPSMVDTVLRRDWGIQDRAALVEMLEWLAAGGHRKEYEDMGARLRAAGRMPADPLHLFKPDEFLSLSIEDQVALRERAGVAGQLLPAHRSLVAWDFGRLIMLARWGFSIGFLSEAEAWIWIERAAAPIEAAFKSWLDVGENYLAGARFWSKNEERVVDDTQAALDHLLDPENAKSAWNRVPFPGAAANPDLARRLEARRTARAKERAGTVRSAVLLVAAVVIAIVAGRLVGPRFHPCDRLEARVCADLGPDMCAVWKGPLAKVGTGSAMAHESRGRRGLADLGMHLLLGWDRERDHETCSAQLDDTVYPATLQGVRATVVASRR
jgi:hypothetical protein